MANTKENLTSMTQVGLYKIAWWLFSISIAITIFEGILRSLILKKGYSWKAAGSSLFIAAVRTLLDMVPYALAFPGMVWLYQYRFFQFSMSEFWHWALLFVAVDFCYYCFHRANHRIRWFWCTHAIHHSSNELNFAANYRLGWLARFTFNFVFFSPLALLGFPPTFIAIMFALNLIAQFWIHADWIPQLGFIEGILNTPSAHRVHHAANREYLNSNYGGIFIVFDRIFGTYTPERKDLPPRYGWVEPSTTDNPFMLQLLPWIALWKDLRKTKNFRQIVKTLVGPP